MMKHIQKFESYNIEDVKSDINFDEIQELLINKMYNLNIKPSIDNIYAELELLKKDRINSLIFHIVKNYLINNNQSSDNQNIMRVSINFFKNKYYEVLKQYKEKLKSDYNLTNDEKNGFVYLPYDDEIIKVPSRIGHKYIPVKILPITDIHDKFSRHKRLKTFHEKGLKCVNCDRVGKYLIAAKDRHGEVHVDLYTKDFELMTVDHIKPKSLGGTYDIENLNPMCQKCNTKKGNTYNEEE